MTSSSRRRISDEAIIDAGSRLGLMRLSVRAVATELGISEMTLYRRTGGIAGLRRLVAEGIVSRQDFPVPAGESPEAALLVLARALRDVVLAHPGIGGHLAGIGSDDAITLARVERVQSAFAERFGWAPEVASLIVALTAEHAIALAELDPASHRDHRAPSQLPDAFPTVRAGALAAEGIDPSERFDWSMRATVRGAMAMLGVVADEGTVPR